MHEITVSYSRINTGEDTAVTRERSDGSTAQLLVYKRGCAVLQERLVNQWLDDVVAWQPAMTS